MYKKFLCLLILPFILIACGSDEPQDGGLFQLKINSVEGDVDLAIGLHSAELGITGQSNTIVVDLVGDFDSFNMSEGIPDWISVSTSGHTLTISIPDYSGDDYRKGKIGFTVFKGSASESGYITITQSPITYQDLRNREIRAIQNYIKQFKVIDKVPEVREMQTGVDAPYYKLDVDGQVYMQVLSKGNGPAPEYGDKIYFRFERYNLIFFMENGYLGASSGNASDLSSSPAYFILDDEDSPYGSAIQMPMLMGLPLGSEVNIVVASDLGFTSEISNVIPYLYKVSYFRDEQIAPSPVYLSFNKSEWMTYGVISVGTHRYFNKEKSLPANFPYSETSATGFGGVLLFGGVGGEPYAFDAACPHEVSASVVVEIDNNSFEAVCPKCKSHFNVLDGSGFPLSGPAYAERYSLKKYRAVKNSNGGYNVMN